MKIAFHIRRLNWYRVLSPVIDKALEMGHDVECWHNAGAELAFNTARIEKAPKFRHGQPKMIEYQPPAKLIELVAENSVDVIIDIMPPNVEFMDKWPLDRPLWVLVDGPPLENLKHIEDDRQLYAVDLFTLRTEFHQGMVTSTMGKDRTTDFAEIEAHRHFLGLEFERMLRSRLSFRWSQENLHYFTEHSAVIGDVALDAFGIIDPDEVRARWDIPRNTPVVGLLPCPFGKSFGALWEELFSRPDVLSRLMCVLKRRGWSYFGDIGGSGHNTNVLYALRKFCDRHGGRLVTKLRYTQKADRLTSNVSNVIVSDDSYYPHTALELFRCANLIVGFYSTAVIETTAAGCPYINVDIPYFPKEIFFDRFFPEFGESFNVKGVTQSVSAQDFCEMFSSANPDEFIMDEAARDKYLELHIGPVDGLRSSCFLDAVECLVR
jgi:hypothetical protein